MITIAEGGWNDTNCDVNDSAYTLCQEDDRSVSDDSKPILFLTECIRHVSIPSFSFHHFFENFKLNRYSKFVPPKYRKHNRKQFLKI